ncbi:hypothetical protein [Roseobacter litoralis]|uniref:hypothetical protein n=1 Tax=Roseobacter litoralis TaxID=42443 RepID=UPI0024952BD7|nr:hypothetical protein [Roseobacter litoralis]
MENHESNIERHARIGQTSDQLASRNAIWRMGFYGLLGGLVFGLASSLLFPSAVVGAVFLGLLIGVGLAVSIEEKMKRDDSLKRSETLKSLSKERERETQSRIAAAQANGDFDRWKIDE